MPELKTAPRIDGGRILALAESAARVAGARIAELRAGAQVEIGFKARRNLVTPSDLEAERIICAMIRGEFPEHAILSEESYQSYTQGFPGPLWIIDPIDGTTNYAHGHHQVAVSIAFAVDGDVLAGVVHCPFTGEIFTALKGHGARLNGKPIHCSDAREFEHSLVATGFPPDRERLPQILKTLHAVLAQCRDLRRNGAASLDICWVAAGRLDAYYETVNIWDMAAGCLIAREAGARTGQFLESEEQLRLPPDLRAQNLLVANPVLFEKFRELLAGTA